MADEVCHSVTFEVSAPAEKVFAFLADPDSFARWSLGCFGGRLDPASGLYSGLSLFDGSRGWVRIDADPARRLIDFAVGTPERLVPRIACRVQDGALIEDPAVSIVTLTALRPRIMSDDRWARLKASHEAEAWLIKAQIESRGG